MRRKQIAAAALVIVGGFALAGCGGNDDSMSDTSGMPGMGASSPTASGTTSTDAMADFNDADVTFATDMIPHHRQAVEMAKLAQTRAESPEVKDLARQIMDAQGPEIQQMSEWLTSWGKPVPEDMTGMDMSDSMPGMMSSEDMDKLMNASGADFDQMFLTMMIKHHEGAIEMARTEQANGTFPDAITLAKQIEIAQSTEIATMQKLLG